MSFSPEIVFGSAAAIWTPKKVIVASTTAGSAGDLRFAAYGLAKYDETDFDALALLAHLLEGDLSDAAEGMEEPLAVAASHLQSCDAVVFKERMGGKDAAGFFVFGKKNDGVFLSHIAFKAKRRGKDVVIETRRSDWPSRSTDIHSLSLVAGGCSPEDEKAFSTTPQQQALVYPEDVLKKFILPPAKMVELGPAGVREKDL